MVVIQSDLVFAVRSEWSVVPQTWPRVGSLRALYKVAVNIHAKKKPNRCTADELHHVSVPNSYWRLALWRYLPSPKVPQRNHPLLLLSGLGANAIGYDLAPESSFARFMSKQGFDTWIVELRGAGLSAQGLDFEEVKQPLNAKSERIDSAVKCETNVAFANSDISLVKGRRTEIVSNSDESQSISNFSKTFMSLPERISGFLNEGFLEVGQKSAISSQIRYLSERLVNIIEGQRSVTPTFFDWQEHFSTTLEEFQKQLDLIVKYDWDFDHYMEEDVPAAMEYIRTQSEPKDGKLLAIGHSMGGILLYAMLSRFCFEGRDSGLASVITLGSSLDYSSSKSSLKLLLPLADPVQALSVPVIPLRALLAAAHSLASRPPYVLSWLNHLISATDTMHPKLLEKLVLTGFGNLPSKLLLQLKTALQEGGLCDRRGSFFYKDHLGKSNVPILALAGDQDLICPPDAVYETVKHIPKHLVNYKVFGEARGPHYAHYDLVGGCLAADQVYPCIIEFLNRHDVT